MRRVTVIGGGFAGLVAAITCAGASVRLLQAHRTLGGRARAAPGLLSEVSFHSAITAAYGTLTRQAGRRIGDGAT